MPAVGLCQSSAASAGRAPLSQIVPAPPNRTAAHTVSQPQRDNKDIMRAGCDTKWVSEAAMAAGHGVEWATNHALPRSSASWPQGCVPHPSHLQEQQQGEQRVKSMLFHMSGEGALLTTCSQRRSPPGADMPVEWICRHRAQLNSSHIPPPHGHLGAAVAFGKGAVGGETLPARRSWRSISAAADCFSGT